MEEVSPVTTAAPDSVGETLRAARERHGLDLSEIASRTRIPLRHLEAIETGNYAGLPSQTYATGFVRAYARAVGADEVAATRRIRDEIATSGPRAPEYQPYEAPDPARVPSRGLAIVTLGIALAIVVLAGLWFSGMLNRGSAPVAVSPGPEAAPAPTAAAPAAVPGPAPSSATSPAPAEAPTPAPPTGGQVTLQTTDRVWMRVHDGDGDRTLYMGTMNPGERFDVPADAVNPLVDIGRPDKLRVTLNGSALPPLPPSERPMKDLRVGAVAVAARLAGGVAPLANSTPVATMPARPAGGVRPKPRPRPATALDETARANLEAARNAPAAPPR